MVISLDYRIVSLKINIDIINKQGFHKLCTWEMWTMLITQGYSTYKGLKNNFMWLW